MTVHAAQPGDDDWRNEDVVDWPHRRWECSRPSGTEELSDGGYEFVFHSLRHVEPMEVHMHELRQLSIKLLGVTDKTSRRIQETL